MRVYQFGVHVAVDALKGTQTVGVISKLHLHHLSGAGLQQADEALRRLGHLAAADHGSDEMEIITKEKIKTKQQQQKQQTCDSRE